MVGGMCVATAAAADVVDICLIIFAVSWYREFLVFVQFIVAVIVVDFVSNIFRTQVIFLLLLLLLLNDFAIYVRTNVVTRHTT